MFRFPARTGSRVASRHGLLALLGAAMLTTSASGVDIIVTTDADSGAGSLREALTNAASGDRIVFDIPGTPTITLASDLPTIAGDISFANNNATAVAIDRNGNAALDFDGSLVNPTVLVINTGGVPSGDADIIAAATTTIFGNGSVTGNLVVPGTLAPGATSTAGSIGTFDVTGDLDITGAQIQLDISGTGNDLINVSGTTTVTNATLVPNFIGSDFSTGQSILVLDSAIRAGTFVNEASTFALPNNPFLEAIEDVSLGANDFGFLIQDNGNTFASFAAGSNQLSAATLLDQLQASATPPASIAPLRNGSSSEVSLAYDQLSGSIYPSLIGAEIFHVQNNLESVRDRAALQRDATDRRSTCMPWVRAYGVSGSVERDHAQTRGYRHEIGGIELGCGLSLGGAISAHSFAHLAAADFESRDVEHRADIESYRLGGLIEYLGQGHYLIVSGGAGVQEYDVRRSLSQFVGSTFTQSSFDGSSQFGYFELGSNHVGPLRPYIGLHATRVELDPVTESGDADFALTNTGGEGESLRGVLGLALIQTNTTLLGTATTRLRCGWLHEYLDASETIVSQVAAGGTLTDRGVDPGTDWGFVRTQVDMGTLLGGQFSVAYEGQFNSDSSFNALLGGLRWLR